MSAPAALVGLAEPWSRIYSDSAVLQTLVVFAHIAALVFAGGLAVTLDRGTLRAARAEGEFRQRQLGELRAAHRLVLTGLTLSLVSGVLLFAADIETYFDAWIFWVKLVLIAALLANGFIMTRAESRIGETPNATDDGGWRTLRVTATASIVLWFAIAFMGVALVNAA
jgi:hypothetical protein